MSPRRPSHANGKRDQLPDRPEIKPPGELPDDTDELERKIEAVLARVVPEQQREPVAEEIVAVMASFQGPLPPPSMLARYDQIADGMAERLVAMAEKEQSHRHDWERRALDTERLYAMSGLTAGWVVAIGLVVGASLVGIFGDWRVGVALAAASATGMVWKLVQGRSDGREPETTDREPNKSTRKQRR